MSSTTDLIRISHVRQMVANKQLAGRLEALSLHQSDVARAIGVKPAAVSRWVAGDRLPRGELALRLAGLLVENQAIATPAERRAVDNSWSTKYYFDRLIEEKSAATDLRTENEKLKRQVKTLTERLQRIEEWVEATSRGRKVGPDV